jgi:hypothetical protein
MAEFLDENFLDDDDSSIGDFSDDELMLEEMNALNDIISRMEAAKNQPHYEKILDDYRGIVMFLLESLKQGKLLIKEQCIFILTKGDFGGNNADRIDFLISTAIVSNKFFNFLKTNSEEKLLCQLIDHLRSTTTYVPINDEQTDIIAKNSQYGISYCRYYNI